MHRCAYPRVWPYMALFLPNLNLRDDFNLTPVLIHVLNRDDFSGSKGFNPSLNRARFASHVEGEQAERFDMLLRYVEAYPLVIV